MAALIDTDINLELPVPPSVNSLWKTNSKGYIYKTKQHNDYVKMVRQICVAHRITPLLGDLGIIIVWYRAAKRRDIDSPIKTLLDSLNGFAYEDDKQICELSIFRSDEEPKNPRILVKVFDLFGQENFTDEDL